MSLKFECYYFHIILLSNVWTYIINKTIKNMDNNLSILIMNLTILIYIYICICNVIIIIIIIVSLIIRL